MAKERERTTIKIDPNSELAKALRDNDGRKVVLVSGGTRYEVVRIERDSAGEDDREAFRAALRAAAGTFTPEEGERLKRDIYRWREEGTKPIDRP